MNTMPSREGDRIKTVQFNGKNFDTFKFSVSIALRNHDLIPIIDGTRTKPEPVCTDPQRSHITVYYAYLKSL